MDAPSSSTEPVSVHTSLSVVAVDQNSSSSQITFLSIPNDVIRMIVGKLDKKSIIALLRVSKKLNAITKTAHLAFLSAWGCEQNAALERYFTADQYVFHYTHLAKRLSQMNRSKNLILDAWITRQAAFLGQCLASSPLSFDMRLRYDNVFYLFYLYVSHFSTWYRYYRFILNTNSTPFTKRFSKTLTTMHESISFATAIAASAATVRMLFVANKDKEWRSSALVTMLPSFFSFLTAAIQPRTPRAYLTKLSATANFLLPLVWFARMGYRRVHPLHYGLWALYGGLGTSLVGRKFGGLTLIGAIIGMIGGAIYKSGSGHIFIAAAAGFALGDRLREKTESHLY